MISPASSMISFGKDVKFECKNAKHIMWFYESYKYNPNSKPISKKAIYLKRNIKSTDTGNYFCFGKYKDKDRTFFSKTSIRVFGMLRRE